MVFFTITLFTSSSSVEVSSSRLFTFCVLFNSPNTLYAVCSNEPTRFENIFKLASNAQLLYLSTFQIDFDKTLLLQNQFVQQDYQ